jgi:hypothetical protein
MTLLHELGGKLKKLDRTRDLACAELGRLHSRRERVEELERDRDAVIESYRGCCPRFWKPCRAKSGGGSTGCSAWRSYPRRMAWRSATLLVHLNPVQQLRDGTGEPG